MGLRPARKQTRKQKRAFAIIHFDSSVKRVDQFPADKQDPGKLLESVSYFSNGGTDFEEPLNRAAALIEEKLNGKQASKMSFAAALARRMVELGKRVQCCSALALVQQLQQAKLQLQLQGALKN